MKTALRIFLVVLLSPLLVVILAVMLFVTVIGYAFTGKWDFFHISEMWSP